MAVVVVGAYTIDLFMYGPRLPNPGETVDCPEYAEADGGKGANQVVAAARRGADTHVITGLGNDRIGQAALAMFAREGVDTRYCFLDDTASTGVGFIIVDKDGQQLITTYAGASARLTETAIQQARPLLEKASVLLLQGEIPPHLSLASAQLTGEQTTVILDPSPVEAFSMDMPLVNVDILTPNQPEAAVLTGQPNPEAAQVVSVTGVPTVILTRGADGVEVFWNDTTHWIPAPHVEVVDTTGAGDAFNGALAAGLDRGLDLLDAIEHACRCAAFSVSRKFCIPAYPTLHDIPWEVS